MPPDVAKEILSILLKKPKIRVKLISALNLGLSNLGTFVKTRKIRAIEELNLLNHIEMKEILEASNLTTLERNNLHDLISKYNVSPKVTNGSKAELENDLPF
jgi:hypothetical protein